MYKRNCTLTQSSVQSLSRVRLLRPNGLHLARLSCPSPTPGAYSNLCPSCRWCHPTVSSSVVPFSSCPQSSPASGSFPMSSYFASGAESTGASASASVLPMNIQDWFPLGLTGRSPCSPRYSQESSPTPQLNSFNSLVLSFFYSSTLISIMTTGKTITFTRWTFVDKVMSLLFNMLSRSCMDVRVGL